MWLVIGVVVGASLSILAFWLRHHGIKLKLYDWLVGASGFGLLLFTIQNVTASIAEHENNPALNFARIFGIPAFALLLIFTGLIWYRRRAGINTHFNKLPKTEKEMGAATTEDKDLRTSKP